MKLQQISLIGKLSNLHPQDINHRKDNESIHHILLNEEFSFSFSFSFFPLLLFFQLNDELKSKLWKIWFQKMFKKWLDDNMILIVRW